MPSSASKRAILSWSSGKDSAWALHVLRQERDIEIVALFTTFNCSADRVAMHAVRRSLVEAQARSTGLPLWTVELNWPCSNGVYEELVAAIWRRAAAERIEAVAFGDFFLADVRAYREQQLQSTGLEALFPLWQMPTPELAADMVRAGVKAKVTCLDPAKLDRSFAGRDFNEAFLSELPAGIDPCGENGEFHTFVSHAPSFSQSVPVVTGQTVERDGFVFVDLLAAEDLDASVGLCAVCGHTKTITSDRGSVFRRCLLSDRDPTFPRYPRLPVRSCSGWQPR